MAELRNRASKYVEEMHALYQNVDYDNVKESDDFIQGLTCGLLDVMDATGQKSAMLREMYKRQNQLRAQDEFLQWNFGNVEISMQLDEFIGDFLTQPEYSVAKHSGAQDPHAFSKLFVAFFLTMIQHQGDMDTQSHDDVLQFCIDQEKQLFESFVMAKETEESIRQEEELLEAMKGGSKMADLLMKHAVAGANGALLAKVAGGVGVLGTLALLIHQIWIGAVDHTTAFIIITKVITIFSRFFLETRVQRASYKEGVSLAAGEERAPQLRVPSAEDYPEYAKLMKEYQIAEEAEGPYGLERPRPAGPEPFRIRAGISVHEMNATERKTLSDIFRSRFLTAPVGATKSIEARYKALQDWDKFRNDKSQLQRFFGIRNLENKDCILENVESCTGPYWTTRQHLYKMVQFANLLHPLHAVADLIDMWSTYFAGRIRKKVGRAEGKHPLWYKWLRSIAGDPLYRRLVMAGLATWFIGLDVNMEFVMQHGYDMLVTALPFMGINGLLWLHRDFAPARSPLKGYENAAMKVVTYAGLGWQCLHLYHKLATPEALETAFRIFTRQPELYMQMYHERPYLLYASFASHVVTAYTIRTILPNTLTRLASWTFGIKDRTPWMRVLQRTIALASVMFPILWNARTLFGNTEHAKTLKAAELTLNNMFSTWESPLTWLFQGMWGAVTVPDFEADIYKSAKDQCVLVYPPDQLVVDYPRSFTYDGETNRLTLDELPLNEAINGFDVSVGVCMSLIHFVLEPRFKELRGMARQFFKGRGFEDPWWLPEAEEFYSEKKHFKKLIDAESRYREELKIPGHKLDEAAQAHYNDVMNHIRQAKLEVGELTEYDLTEDESKMELDLYEASQEILKSRFVGKIFKTGPGGEVAAQMSLNQIDQDLWREHANTPAGLVVTFPNGVFGGRGYQAFKQALFGAKGPQTRGAPEAKSTDAEMMADYHSASRASPLGHAPAGPTPTFYPGVTRTTVVPTKPVSSASTGPAPPATRRRKPIEIFERGVYNG